MYATNYKMILFSGADRGSFLQGQLTQDIDRLREAASLPAALCNPKGRVIVTCQLFNLADSIGMAVPTSMADAVSKRLTMYRLRADVQIAMGDDHCLVEAFRTVGLDAFQSPQERIASGLAEIIDENSEQYTPHMLNLDLTGAISFTKGCYTGQEVVARTENLGTVKRRLNRYRLSDSNAKIGDKLSDGDRDAGRVVNVGTDEILAVTAVDQHQKMLRLGTGTATPLPLPYKLT